MTSVKKRFQKGKFDLRCRRILSTPPVKTTDSGPTIVSMVCHSDLVMYLLSLKSFLRQLNAGRVVVLDDGTLTEPDKTALRAHVFGCEIIPAKKMRSNNCPQYISWKRLLFISDIVADEYVIQLDSDLLTFNKVPEVSECVVNNRSFILGTWKKQVIEPMQSICERAKRVVSDHVQVVAERNFDKLAQYEKLAYVRGCAGFAGFAKGSFSRDSVEAFSEQMYSIIRSKWSEWGSEQTASNYLVANASSAMVLPYPKYGGFRPGQLESGALMHFSGIHRFEGDVYARLGGQMIDRLCNGAVSDSQCSCG